MKNLLIVSMFLCLALPAFADDDSMFTMIYQKQNRWVAQDDIKSLRNMLAESKKRDVSHFYVRIPEEQRGLTIERLVVLRDILEKSLKRSIVIEEIPGDAKKNEIVILFENAVAEQAPEEAAPVVAPMATPALQVEELN